MKHPGQHKRVLHGFVGRHVLCCQLADKAQGPAHSPWETQPVPGHQDTVGEEGRMAEVCCTWAQAGPEPQSSEGAQETNSPTSGKPLFSPAQTV